MDPNSIALVGMMGTGKSAVGRALAERLGWRFVDLDSAIEQASNRSVATVFREVGEPVFRKLEADTLAALSHDHARTVLAPGGGVIETPTNRELLKSAWFSIWLDAHVETLVRRLRADMTERPLLQSLAPDVGKQRLHMLYERRVAWYREVSRYSIQVDDLSIPEVIGRIVTLI